MTPASCSNLTACLIQMRGIYSDGEVTGGFDVSAHEDRGIDVNSVVRCDGLDVRRSPSVEKAIKFFLNIR